MEIKSTTAEKNNSLEGLNIRIELAEEIISILENWKKWLLQSKEQRVKWMNKNE